MNFTSSFNENPAAGALSRLHSLYLMTRKHTPSDKTKKHKPSDSESGKSPAPESSSQPAAHPPKPALGSALKFALRNQKPNSGQ